MTAGRLRLLLVESSSADAQRTLNKLNQSGYLVEYRQVADVASMKQALSSQSFDLVLCSYDPPEFGGLEALQVMHESGIDLPFLFLSHDLREKTIIHAMHSGADDYILKGSLNRLAPAIEHNLREARIRREHREARLALQENEIRLHAFIANLPGLAYQILRQRDNTLTFPYVSEGCFALLGIPHPELESNADLFHTMLHHEDRASYQETMLASAQALSFWNWEGRIQLPPSGEIKWINLRCTPRRLDDGNTMWEGMMFNITQSKQAELEISRSREQLRALSHHIQDVREQERLHIAREVHDNLGSLLTAIKLDISWLGGKLAAEKHPLTEKFRNVAEVTDQCIAAARDISRTLRPSVLDNFGIVAALEMEAGEFTKRTSIPCKLELDDDGTQLTPEISIAVFRIFQEALNNIIKHAHATEVAVKLTNRAEHIALSVKDNGQGIAQHDRLKPRSFGLRGLQERVAHFGGSFRLESKPGKGTLVAVELPHYFPVDSLSDITHAISHPH